MTSRAHHVSSSRPDVRRQLFRTQQSHTRSHSSAASTGATTAASTTSSLSAITAPTNLSSNAVAGPSRHRRGRPRSEILDDFDSSIVTDSAPSTITTTSAAVAAAAAVPTISSSTIRTMDPMAMHKKKINPKQPDVNGILIRNSDGSFDEHVEIPLEMVASVLQQREDDSIQQDMIDYGNRELAYKMPNLLAAVQAALRNKVLSLQDDNWMFEE